MAEYGETFVLDMGEPVRIVDLVHNVRRRRCTAGGLAISYTGLRPGEKLHEKVFSDAGGPDPDRAPRRSGPPAAPTVGETSARCSTACTPRPGGNDPDRVQATLTQLLPGLRAGHGQRRRAAPGAPYPDGF